MKRYSIVNSIAFLFLLLPQILFSQNGNKNFTLDDLLKGRIFRSKGINEIRSMKDGSHYTALSEDNSYIISYDYKTGDSISKIFDLNRFKTDQVTTIYDYEFSDDESAILIQTSYEPIYRRSFTADYYIYNTIDKSFKPLSNNGKQQLATFSPDGKKVAFVRENNLFIVNLLNVKETQITNDGKLNEIINGAPDWVYEEEFEFNKAFTWSEDSKRLAYMKFDERKVKMFNMTMFKGSKPAIEENANYPSNTQFKYPKAGEDNSIVSVLIYEIESGNTSHVNIGTEIDQYIPRIMFTKDPTMLAVLRLNRMQNKLEILGVNTETNQTKVIYTENNKYYIDESNFDNIKFQSDGSFIITSEMNGWTHLYKCDINSGKISQLTNGAFDVTAYYGFDPINKLHFYQAAAISPMQREIYSIKSDGTGTKLISKSKGTNNAQFSDSFRYFILTNSSVKDVPEYSLCESNGKLIRILESNKELSEKLENYRFRYKEFFKIHTSEGIELNAYAIYPPNFDPEKKYPVIIDQYSGPNSQTVLDSWSFDFDDCMAQEGFVIVSIDPRGTGARGEAFRKVTYLQLGKFETIDMIESAQYLAQLPWVDSKRIGIWGWSYGGFVSTSCMLKGNGIFNTGVAVAPVTNWRYYDNIYTERFMRTPQENPEGYDENSPLYFADKLQGNLLLIHGTADDNVHVQNTLELSEQLVQANKQFDIMVYTNRNHSIYGGNTRVHLYTKILRYFKENLLSKGSGKVS
ncbi:MAG TPA: S9 family peptidase [Lentimicrobium sp.]|nr:S9 family peptidase [Lentimicrobium sp.]